MKPFLLHPDPLYLLSVLFYLMLWALHREGLREMRFGLLRHMDRWTEKEHLLIPEMIYIYQGTTVEKILKSLGCGLALLSPYLPLAVNKGTPQTAFLSLET